MLLHRDEKFVMAYQQHQLSPLQRLLPAAKKVPGGVKGRVCMTLQEGASTPDILTGILQVRLVPLCFHICLVWLWVHAASTELDDCAQCHCTSHSMMWLPGGQFAATKA